MGVQLQSTLLCVRLTLGQVKIEFSREAYFLAMTPSLKDDRR